MKPETIDVLWKLASGRIIELRNSRNLARAQMGLSHPAVVSLNGEVDKLADALIELRGLKFPSLAPVVAAVAAPGRRPWEERYWCGDCAKACSDPGAQRRRICPECGGTLLVTMDVQSA